MSLPDLPRRVAGSADEPRLAAARDAAWKVRGAHTFDAHADRLVATFSSLL